MLKFSFSSFSFSSWRVTMKKHSFPSQTQQICDFMYLNSKGTGSFPCPNSPSWIMAQEGNKTPSFLKFRNSFAAAFHSINYYFLLMDEGNHHFSSEGGRVWKTEVVLHLPVGASLVARWLRIRLPAQGTRV